MSSMRYFLKNSISCGVNRGFNFDEISCLTLTGSGESPIARASATFNPMSITLTTNPLVVRVSSSNVLAMSYPLISASCTARMVICLAVALASNFLAALTMYPLSVMIAMSYRCPKHAASRIGLKPSFSMKRILSYS